MCRRVGTDVGSRSYAVESQQQQYSQDPQAMYQQQGQQIQEQQQRQYQPQQEQGVQTSFNSFPQGNAFGNRYPSNASPYGQQQQQQSQQPEDHSLTNAASPYAPFKSDVAAPSQYYQQQQAPSHSPAPQAQGQNPQSSYGAFNSLPQSAGQSAGQPAAYGSSQSDYAAVYGQDALRNMVSLVVRIPRFPSLTIRL